MANRDFILQRICIYAGREIDPDDNKQVADILRSKFNVHLPQRASFNESLELAICDHEIISLILQYRKAV